MATNSGYRKLGYLGFLGFFGLLGLFGRAEMMSLFVLFGLFALFFTPLAKSDGSKKSSSWWAIACAGCAAIIVFAIVLAQYGPRIAKRTCGP